MDDHPGYGSAETGKKNKREITPEVQTPARAREGPKRKSS